MKYAYNLLLLLLGVTGFRTASAQTEARWYTSKGTFKTVLTDTITPRTVDSFIARVTEKFYDGLIFHRVINNFMYREVTRLAQALADRDILSRMNLTHR